MKNGLVWFTDDLRVSENPSLYEARLAERLLCVYVVDPRWFKPGHYGVSPMSYGRWAFIEEALIDLNRQLNKHGHALHVVYGDTHTELEALIARFKITDLFVSKPFGWNEIRQQETLRQRLPSLVIHQANSYSLFSDHQIRAVSLVSLKWPVSFSSFRRAVERTPVHDWETIDHWPEPLTQRCLNVTQPNWLPEPTPSLRSFLGGQQQAADHWEAYRNSQSIHHYKASRNAIDAWSSSAKISPWINQGAVSVRKVFTDVKTVEINSPSPGDVEWIRVELLWREFFQWLGKSVGINLFRFQGLSNTRPLTSYYADRFQKWCHGETPWPLVNAVMKQLSATGFISNRARQVAASALVNELQVDWRFGAAWFQHHLLDHDVNVNWGNWQYIAGVGVDPRGGRHFDIDKQAQLFDADGAYRRRWASNVTSPLLDELDPTGWPVGYL